MSTQFIAIIGSVVFIVLYICGVFNNDLTAEVILQKAGYKNVMILHLNKPKCPTGYLFWSEYLADRSYDDYREHGYVCTGNILKDPILGMYDE